MTIANNKVSIGLTNPKSPSNVGAVMRAAGCYQVDAVYYTGQRYARAAKFNTDTKRAADRIPLLALGSFFDLNQEHNTNGAALVCVELVEGAQPLPEFVHPENAFYVFGPEDGTLSQALINQSDAVIYVPTIGCMNLAATVNVVLYDRLAKSSNQLASDDLIKLSRDTNNTLKTKLRS